MVETIEYKYNKKGKGGRSASLKINGIEMAGMLTGFHLWQSAIETPSFGLFNSLGSVPEGCTDEESINAIQNLAKSFGYKLVKDESGSNEPDLDVKAPDLTHPE